jgi:nicotinate-nucleotide adenylyltransferase
VKRKIRKLGIMGGTFNPIHYGHLVTAEEAYHQFSLDLVIFMPAGHPPHKEDGDIIPGEDRYLMTVIATSSNPHFTASRLEIDRPGPSYTIDTLRELRKIYGPQVDFFFITGADAILEILTWKDSEKIYEMCSFIAATRPGYSLQKFKELHLIENNPSKKPVVHFIEVPALAISSTDIRRRVREGKPIRYLVPDEVAIYIEKNGFYRGRRS